MSLKEKIGIVLSTKMEKTIVVLVQNKSRHPKYNKIIIKSKRYLVHDENNEANIGNKVVLMQSRPISRRKHWTLKQILN